MGYARISFSGSWARPVSARRRWNRHVCIVLVMALLPAQRRAERDAVFGRVVVGSRRMSSTPSVMSGPNIQRQPVRQARSSASENIRPA